MTFRQLFLLLLPCLALFLNSCCQPPPANYTQRPATLNKISKLEKDLLKLLPKTQAVKPEVQKEAHWISKTAYAQSAEIARVNEHLLFGWLNNILVNSKIKKRGLCWHYQHDLYRELRHRPLHYFHLGLTTRDKGKGSSHSCVWVNHKGGGFANSLVLDAWARCGHLKVIPAEDRGDNWIDEPDWEKYVGQAFPEGHTYSMKAYIKDSE